MEYNVSEDIDICSSVLGKGSYGVVRKVLLDGRQVAVKQISKHKFNPLEVSIMVTYDCRLLNKALLVDTDSNGNYLLYQDIAVCDLRERMCKGDMSDTLKKTWMLDMCEALLFLRKENIVHGDIKPSNILTYANDTIKLSDFGCSVLVSPECSSFSVNTIGTLGYTAPETLSMGHISHKSDIWSLGCLFYELMTHKKLLSIKTDHPHAKATALRSIQQWRRRYGDNVLHSTRDIKCIPITFSLTGSAANLIHSMLQYDPLERATITSTCDHIWFRPINKKPRIMTVRVHCLMIDNLKSHHADIVEYLVTRKVTLPKCIINKATHLYRLMESRTRTSLECAIQIAYKLYRYEVEHYHPIAKKTLLNSLEEEFYKSIGFMIHKSSFHDTYVELEEL